MGGTGRNTGKTTLVEKLLAKFALRMPVTAIKMANNKPDEMQHHGHDVSGFHEKILLQRETRTDGNKDSMRFLKAGASVSWYIQTEDAFLAKTFPEIEQILKGAQWGICESNSLYRFVRPALFIMIRGKGERGEKNTSGPFQAADVVVEAMNSEQFDALVKAVDTEGDKFVLKPGSGFF